MSSLMLIFISWKSGYTMRRVGATGLWNRLIQLFYQTFPWDVLQENSLRQFASCSMKDFSPKRHNVTRRKLYLQIRKVTAVLQLFFVSYVSTFTNVEVKQKLCNDMY